jgi:hypothetical protein
LEKIAEQILSERERGGGRRGAGVSGGPNSVYTHMNKCINDKE